MADSTTADVAKTKASEPRKEIKSYSVDKDSTYKFLTTRLQAVISQDHADINLDSDKTDSQRLEDDDENKTGILDESAIETLNFDLALADQQTIVPSLVDAKTRRTLKRKTEAVNDQINESNQDQLKMLGVKKFLLNRALSVTATSTPPDTGENLIDSIISSENEKNRITGDIDQQIKLEMGAKRFGLSLKLSEAELKKARKIRFGQEIALRNVTSNSNKFCLVERVEKFKKRAERFGQSVPKIMTDIENKERRQSARLAKRKALVWLKNSGST